MKKISCFLICLLAGASCTQTFDPEDALPRNRNAATRSITPVTNPYIDWEDTTKINIVGHGPVTLPWYNGAEGSIPDYILQDYKRSDGWELLYNFCSDEVENAGGDKNYLIFYNKLTGKLRVYYYSKEIVTNGTTTVAQFRTSGPTKLFHFNEGYYARHYYMSGGPLEVCTSSITTSESHATVLGWNCFEVELSYDPVATNEHLHIGFYDQNISKLSLRGILNLQTDGTIVTTNVNNSLKPLLNLAGDAAGKAIEEAYEKGKKKKEDQAAQTRAFINWGKALGTVGSKIVSSGLNLLFGGFLGRFDKTTETRSTVGLKTEGTAEFTGKIQSTIASAIHPIQNLLIPGAPASGSDHIIPLYNQPLGAWNVKYPPTIEMDMVMTPTIYPVTPQPSGQKAYCVDYERFLRKKPFGKEDIFINPETLACLSDYEVRVDYYAVAKYDGEYIAENKGNYGMYLTKCVYEDTYSDDEWKAKQEDEGTKDNTIYPEEYKKIRTLLYEVDDRRAEFRNSRFDRPDYSYPSWMSDEEALKQMGNSVTYKNPSTSFYTNLMAKVSVIFYPKAPYNDKPILFTKTFKPQIVNTAVTQRPLFIYNPYVKPEYVSDKQLWERRWDWVK